MEEFDEEGFRRELLEALLPEVDSLMNEETRARVAEKANTVISKYVPLPSFSVQINPEAGRVNVKLLLTRIGPIPICFKFEEEA